MDRMDWFDFTQAGYENEGLAAVCMQLLSPGRIALELVKRPLDGHCRGAAFGLYGCAAISVVVANADTVAFHAHPLAAAWRSERSWSVSPSEKRYSFGLR
jgi:hypothetical protein